MVQGKVFYDLVSHRGESTTTVCGINYQILSVMLLILLLLAGHNQLLTMASETVDPIDWPSETVDPIDWPLAPTPPTLMSRIPRVLCAQYKSVQLLSKIDPATFSIRCIHLAYVATQDRTELLLGLWDLFFCAHFTFHTHAFLLMYFCFFVFFHLAVPMRKCLGKHLFMISTMELAFALLESTLFWLRSAIKLIVI